MRQGPVMPWHWSLLNVCLHSFSCCSQSRAVGCRKRSVQDMNFTSQLITAFVAKESKKLSTREQRPAEKLEMEGRGAEGGNWDGLSPEVLDMIFQHLPVQDLLSCSVMSKNWKKAARDVLKRSRECYAHINFFHEDIEDLNDMIGSSDIMEMINGLHIRYERRPEEGRRCEPVFWHNRCLCSEVAIMLRSGEARRKLDEAKQKIHLVLCGQWQYLDLDIGWQYVVSLDKGLLLREVILATSDSLQKLVFMKCTDWKFIPCCGKPFAKLKVIQTQRVEDLKCCLNSSLSNFAPNLDMITGAMMDLNPQVNRFILERMKNIRVPSNCRQSFEVPQPQPVHMRPPFWMRPPFHMRPPLIVRLPHFEVPKEEVFQAVSGLHRLDVQRNVYSGHEQPNPLGSSAFIFPFVLRSLNTLKELRMYTLDLYDLLMATDELKFPNLRRLSLATHWNVSKTSEICILKTLNLPKLCPNLEFLELPEDHSYREDQQEQVIPVGEPDQLDRSNLPIRIELTCRDVRYNHEYLAFLSSIYPEIRKLRLLKLRSVDDYDVSKIFWDLESLEYLEINVPYPLHDIDFDIEALLSGINIEEAQLTCLRPQRQEDVLNLCVVAIRPSLLNAKRLKELKITVEMRHVMPPGSVTQTRLQPVDQWELDHWETVSRSWVTPVTENLPERHVRNLKVTIEANQRLCDRLFFTRAIRLLRANEIRD